MPRKAPKHSQLDLFGGIASRDELLALAVALGAPSIPGWSQSEEALIRHLPVVAAGLVAAVREQIVAGEDVLGDLFSALTSAEVRRPQGATYTPLTIVASMLAWAREHARPARVVDPGAGSARFLIGAAQVFPDAQLLGIEMDPFAAILARGNLAVHQLADRARIVLDDYRDVRIPAVTGQTLYIGNPPYVRHHLIEPQWKKWLVATATRYRISASQLAGLHVYFFLATAEHARPGDIGLFISAAEWLDVNYGNTVRDLLLHVLGANNLQIIEPTAEPFPGTATTAVITGFEVGAQPQTIGIRRVSSLLDLGALPPAWMIHRGRLESAPRWSPLTRVVPEKREGFIELGELCRVHRGQVTGANRIWIAGAHSAILPKHLLYPTVTKARELFDVQGELTDTSTLRQVIDIPVDLAVFTQEERAAIEKFLAFAKTEGADQGYIARERKAWWSVGLRQPAPILATYMARRPPAFVRNAAGARHINIAHGLYPREELSLAVLEPLVEYLTHNISVTDGRTYAGGLTKFEPREMERLLVPSPALLLQGYREEFA